MLLSLGGRKRPGNAMLKDVAEQTADSLRIGPGTIYGTLRRVMEAGWVEEANTPAPDQDKRRRYYRPTRAGRDALAREVARLGSLMTLARKHGRSLAEDPVAYRRLVDYVPEEPHLSRN